MILVELYSKHDCHLCDEAKIVIEKVRAQVPFTLREITLTPGEEYFDEYKDMIPVVHIDKVFAFKYRVNEHILRIKLQQLSAGRRSAVDGDQTT